MCVGGEEGGEEGGIEWNCIGRLKNLEQQLGGLLLHSGGELSKVQNFIIDTWLRSWHHVVSKEQTSTVSGCEGRG